MWSGTNKLDKKYTGYTNCKFINIYLDHKIGSNDGNIMSMNESSLYQDMVVKTQCITK